MFQHVLCVYPYRRELNHAGFFPPLGDRDAQRQWLGGFGAAWASDLDDEESVDEALARALEGRAECDSALRRREDSCGTPHDL